MNGDLDLVLNILNEAHANIDGPAHQALRNQRGQRLSNPKTTTHPKVPLESLLTHGRYTVAGLSRATGVSPCTLYSLGRRGVSIFRADELACRVGLHPAVVWGNSFYQSSGAA